MGLLNEAVMRVWGWRAGCPAASWASLCCGGLIESKEEAHFRVIYYHPNTSCLLLCCAPYPAPSWGESLPLLKFSESPPFSLIIGLHSYSYMCTCVNIIYLCKYKCMYVHGYGYIHIHSFFVCFLIEGPGQRQGQVRKLLCWELCHQGLDLSSVPH